MRRLLLTCGAVIVLAAAARAELLTNGNFEDGPTGNISAGIPGWNSWGGSGWHHDDAGRTLDAKAVVFWWDDAGIWQDFAVSPGVGYTFGVQAFSWPNDPLHLWNGLLKAEFYNSAIGTGPGQAISEFELDRFYSASDPTNTWVSLGGLAVAPAGADVGRIVLKINDWQSGVSGVLNFDNATVTPEPAMLTLLACAGVALCGGKRRR